MPTMAREPSLSSGSTPDQPLPSPLRVEWLANPSHLYAAPCHSWPSTPEGTPATIRGTSGLQTAGSPSPRLVRWAQSLKNKARPAGILRFLLALATPSPPHSARSPRWNGSGGCGLCGPKPRGGGEVRAIASVARLVNFAGEAGGSPLCSGAACLCQDPGAWLHIRGGHVLGARRRCHLDICV